LNADYQYNGDDENGPAKDERQHEWTFKQLIDWGHKARGNSEGDQSRQHHYRSADQRERGREESNFTLRSLNRHIAYGLRIDLLEPPIKVLNPPPQHPPPNDKLTKNATTVLLRTYGPAQHTQDAGG